MGALALFIFYLLTLYPLNPAPIFWGRGWGWGVRTDARERSLVSG